MSKPVNPWDEVFSRITAEHRIDWRYPPKPTASDLNSVEEELGFRFPLSFRDFAERFGLNGTIYTLPHFLPLTLQTDTDWSVRGVTQYLRQKSHEYWNLPANPSPLFSRMVAFAEDGGYDKFVFDPAEITEPHSLEYMVYAIDRTAEIRPVAESFPEFLVYLRDRYCFDPADEYEPGEYVDELLPWKVFKPNSSHPIPITYRCYVTGKKELPPDHDVKQWLAFNNHTVRDLATSIRDEIHSDAFPILADALEEAGCTNADLLESCRRGDPDIDGVWVLRVLLGQ